MIMNHLRSLLVLSASLSPEKRLITNEINFIKFYFFIVLLISMKFGATLIIEKQIIESGKIS